MLLRILKNFHFWLICICAVIIGLILYNAYLLFEMDQKDVFEIIVFPLIIQPFIIIIFFQIWNIMKDLKNEDSKKVKLNKEQLHKKYHQEECVSWKKYKTTAAPLFIPKKALSVNSIDCILEKEIYNVPSPLINKNTEKLLRSHRQSMLFNSQTLRLKKVESLGEKKLNLEFIYSDYISHAVTNLAADICVSEKLTVRNILEPGPKLTPLHIAKPSNHLGVSVLIKTSDGKLILPMRRDDVSFNKGCFSPSVSGAFTTDICLDKDGEVDLKRMIRKECDEELSPKMNLKKIHLLGIVRELDRLGKPEMFFFAETSDTEEEVQEKIKKNPDFKAENKKVKFIDVDEMESLLEKKKVCRPLETAIVLCCMSKDLS